MNPIYLSFIYFFYVIEYISIIEIICLVELNIYIAV